MSRRAELAENLARVHQQIAVACAAAGRDPGQVTLIAVSKSFPAADLAELAALGQFDVAENREHEARAKHSALTGLPLRWHFVGQVQTNKARLLAGYVDVVHSVDRPHLVTALSAGAERAQRSVDVFIQVGLSDRAGRGGVAAEGLARLADAVAAAPALRLVGLMGIAPLGAPSGVAFGRLAELSAELRRAHPQATGLSAGMSGDFQVALANGATHLRIGTALLGRRATKVG